MENSNSSTNSNNQKTEFKRFATKRIIVVTLLTVVGIWVVGAVLGFFEMKRLKAPKPLKATKPLKASNQLKKSPIMPRIRLAAS